MAGAILNRQLTAHKSAVQFAVAEQKHDAEIRRLLRDNPTRGNISLSFTREPHYFADAHGHFGDKQTIVATRGDKVICVGSCLTRTCFVNGQPKKVGYLGGLRLDASVSGEFNTLRRGYEFFRELQSEAPADLYFTSIASDNVRARHFLEAGISGMPKYEFIGEYITLVIPTNRVPPPKPKSVSVPNSSEFLNFVNEHNSQLQFAPFWIERELAALKDLGMDSDAYVIRDANNVEACAKLWDQRSFKQTVIHDYSRSLTVARPFINAFSPLLRQPRLPAGGTILSEAYISCVAWNDPKSLLAIVSDSSALAAQKRFQFIVLGMAANNLSLGLLIRKLNCRQYRSRIYVVCWPDCGGAADELDQRPIGPEVALL
jgi:hypothetical protein